MKRSHLVFVTVVFTIVLTGVIFERTGRDEAPGDFELAPRGLSMRPFEVPGGDLGLTGRVVDAEGRPAADVRLHLWKTSAAPGTAEPMHGEATDAEGRFALAGLAAGGYQVALLQVGHPNTRLEVEIPAAGPVEWILAPRHPPLDTLPPLVRRDLEGRLLPPEGSGAEDVPRGGYEVLVSPAAEVHPLSGAVQRRTRTDDAGHFRLEGLALADYRIQVLPPWAAGGAWPVLGEVVHVHDGVGVDRPLALRLRTGELEGRLEVGGAPVAGALVTVRSATDPHRQWPPRPTDAGGGFLVRDLPPGPYLVRARAGDAAWEARVTVRSGERIEVELLPVADPPG